jgi:DNA-binding NarL/FixJ family response regulator
MKILLADDSELMIERLQQMLAGIDQAEVVASLDNGIDALSYLKTLNPDLAILDFHMPGLNGAEVINAYKKENKSVIFIMLTFQLQGYYKHLAIQAGSDYFFNKADDFETIGQIVAELCEQHQEKIYI